MLIIRRALATDEDAKGILDVHFAAVHGEPVDYYDEEILEDWSPVVDEERVANFLTRPQREDEVLLVAEMDKSLVGFGTVVPRLNELRACYVLPRLSRQGIGRSLLAELERSAQKLGVDWLNLNASLNAEPFYLANGFVADGLGRQILPGGREMSCVRMYKFLDNENSKWSRGELP